MAWFRCRKSRENVNTVLKDVLSETMFRIKKAIDG